jgi:hypothetical protein
MLHEAVSCTVHLPCAIGDYTDFYVGIHHATNIGKQFRPRQSAAAELQICPNRVSWARVVRAAFGRAGAPPERTDQGGGRC